MRLLLRAAYSIDALNERIGRAIYWLVLAAALISTLNALTRYLFESASNAALEAQWYMFALIFLFAAGYTLRHDGHVRIDVIYGRFSPSARAWIDILGGIFFLLPATIAILWLSWPMVVASIQVLETSPDPGGLPRWPIKLAIPLGFGLLTLQGVSEIIKRIAYLAGEAPPPQPHERALQ
jgi:TRAP-type mannitol/chloroaromatic compound transport system permease small subunit